MDRGMTWDKSHQKFISEIFRMVKESMVEEYIDYLSKQIDFFEHGRIISDSDLICIDKEVKLYSETISELIMFQVEAMPKP